MSTSFDWGAAPSVAVVPHATSYFSTPETFLDPRLFDGMHMHPTVRWSLLTAALSALDKRFHSPENWCKAYVAGSGVSFQWSANRDPGDLDVLLGIDYTTFRRDNPNLRGLSLIEITKYVNDYLYSEVWPKMKNWVPPGTSESQTGSFEVTLYVNPNSYDIRSINPYAAYDLTDDRWAVPPDPTPYRPDYSADAERHKHAVMALLNRYHEAQEGLVSAANPMLRDKHQRTLQDSLEQASAMYRDIHEGRHDAFRPGGQGYADPSNALWQHGKQMGTVHALKALHDFYVEGQASEEIRRYGVRLPSTDDLVLRALTVYDR